jgi:molybdate transport system permease protein
VTHGRAAVRDGFAAGRGDGVVTPGVPWVVRVPAVLALALLVLPVVALVVRAEWSTLPADISSHAAVQALTLSLVTSGVATLACVLLGVPLAILLARTRGWAADLLRALVTLPLVLPPTVGGIALLYLLGRRGLVGQSLDAWFGITIPFTTTAVVIAQAFVAMPFLVLGVEGALRTVDPRYEGVAAGLGASRWTVLRRVTLPLVAPGLVSGTVLCFARALGEFGATALFAGNAPGVTQTMPLAIYSAFNGAGVTQGAAVALSLLLVAAAIAVLLAARAWRPGRAT